MNPYKRAVFIALVNLVVGLGVLLFIKDRMETKQTTINTEAKKP